jgi:phosphatidylserine decarboxylase
LKSEQNHPFIAREGWPYIGYGLLASGITALLYRRLALIPLITTGLLAAFFRDPQRVTGSDTRVVYAPADGHILKIEQVVEPRFLGEPAWQIAVVLSLFDVHINRSPTTGIVRYRSYQAGAYHPILYPQAEQENERNFIGIETALGPILVMQMSGAVARRIVCYPEVGDTVTGGERIGLIKFGSRTDLFVPSRIATPLVQRWQSVQGGVTPLLQINSTS